MLLPLSSRNNDERSEAEARLVCELADHGLFEGLESDQIVRLVPTCRVKTFNDEEIGCHCHDVHHDAFVVAEGTVAISYTVGGLEHTVELAGFGAVFNVGGMFGFVERHKGARALGTVKLMAIDTEILRRMLDDDTRLGYPVLKNLARLLMAQFDRELEHQLT